MEQLMSTLSQTLVTILCAVISLLGVMAVYYLTKLKNKATAETTKIQNEATQEYADSVIATVYDFLSVAVDKMEVTLVKELKATTEDGKLTKEDQKTVATAAYSLFKQLINDDAMAALHDVVGDTETYVYSLIDSIVLEKKNELLKAGVITTDTTEEETTELNG